MTQASIETYQEPETKAKIKSQAAIVFEHIQEHQPVNVDKLVYYTRMPSIAITRRIAELHDQGLIYVAGQVKSGKRTQSLWSITQPHLIDLVIKKRHYQRYIKWLKQSNEFLAYLPEEARESLSKLLVK